MYSRTCLLCHCLAATISYDSSIPTLRYHVTIYLIKRMLTHIPHFIYLTSCSPRTDQSFQKFPEQQHMLGDLPKRLSFMKPSYYLHNILNLPLLSLHASVLYSTYELYHHNYRRYITVILLIDRKNNFYVVALFNTADMILRELVVC
jgi:hypothetical protein